MNLTKKEVEVFLKLRGVRWKGKRLQFAHGTDICWRCLSVKKEVKATRYVYWVWDKTSNMKEGMLGAVVPVCNKDFKIYIDAGWTEL